MKKIAIVVLFVFMAGYAMCNYIQAPEARDEFKYEPNTDSLSQWVILGIDAASTAFAVWAVLDAEDYIKKYNKLHSEIDDGTPENYQKLTRMKKEADKRASSAVIACVVAGSFIAYTLADYFFVKEIFPEGLKLFFDPAGRESVLAYQMKF